ncbi:hypothetical protein CEQ90_13220 [Lewinellaceae bacterium SD302]|nr:hypothetical protein CEQ90_13220 [Lewinellaceae bacterium SD302]
MSFPPKSFLIILLYWTAFSSLAAQTADYNLTFEDEDGYPLTGVMATDAEGDFLGQSDAAGNLSLSDIETETELNFQYLGYETIIGNDNELGLVVDQVNLIRLTPIAATLTTVAVIGRRNEQARELPYLVETVSEKEIKLLQSSNSADALADLSGVYVQKSQFGGGSPIVRGFEANRVLLVVDGVRMNNAIYRNGHLQNAITVDVNALSRMELIYGPGSLAYGSDALGGVIHFRTKRPDFRTVEPGWSLGGQINYASASQAKLTGFNLEYGNKHFASYTQLSFADFGELRAGDDRREDFPNFGRRDLYVERINGQDSVVRNEDPNVQIGTAYRQFDLLQKFRFRLADKVELSSNLQISTSSDVPRYDNLSEISDGELRWAEWNYGPQNRLLASLRLDDRRGGKFFDLSSLLFSQQFIEEDRITRRNDQAEREISEVDVYSSNFQWDLAKSFVNERQLKYGIDARYDRVISTASLFDVDANAEIDQVIPTRYPSSGSSLTTIGAYVDYKHPLSEKFIAQAGLRLNRQWLGATFSADDPVEWPQNYLDGIKNATGALTGAASIRYQHRGHRIRLLFAQGFRSPNVDDFAKFRESNGFIQVPNPELGSERSNSLEFGYERNLPGGWRFWAVGYHTWLDNVIVRDAFSLPNGSDLFISFGDTLRVQANVNAESARIYGADLGFKKQFESGLYLGGDVHWLEGIRNQRADDGALLKLPQDHIPPVYGNFSLGFTSENWQARLRFRFQLAKQFDNYAVGNIITLENSYELDRTGTSDNLELTPIDPNTGEFTGSYGWSTLNLNLQRRIGERLSINIGVENIFDLHYRTFASGVSAAGRNFLVGVRWK